MELSVKIFRHRIPYVKEHISANKYFEFKTHGAAALHTRITWMSFLGSEEPLLKILPSTEVHRMNSSPISNWRHSKSTIFISRNINYNIN